MTKATMWLLLAVVATAAAVLSFAALDNLAVLCGFSRSLAWLLPIVIDAGAGVGCLVWLGTKSPRRALRFARTLTWALLAVSVAGNAVDHYLAAYDLRPTWSLVVIVSAVAPAVLGSCVHLAVLVGRAPNCSQTPEVIGQDNSPDAREPAPSPVKAAVVPRPKPVSVPRGSDNSSAERARALLAAEPGIGRRALSKRAGVSEYVARTVLAEQAPRNGVKVLEDAR